MRCGLLALDRARAGRGSPAGRGRRRSRGRRGQCVARAVGGELDAVAVGVGEVDRLVGAVVGGAVDRRLGDAQAHGGAGELLAARVQQRVVVEAGVAARGRASGSSWRITVVVVPSPSVGGGRLVGVDAQAERALVPGDRAVEVGDGEVDGAEGEGGGKGRSLGCRGHGTRIARRARIAYGRTSRRHGHRPSCRAAGGGAARRRRVRDGGRARRAARRTATTTTSCCGRGRAPART